MKAVLILIWIGQLSSVIVAALILVTGFTSASGAPQQAVVAALACAVAILPYCFARGMTEIVAVADSMPKPQEDEPKPVADPTRPTFGLG